ncbi:unnamed protein product [Sphenostylis stenocarpa]|uniref:Uncharacterized protein n=1 Tax=Sphenostylis stenocarpa TaxID=92480 RepID=A0AA86SH99_9FABA|nr:unnamed protein product [Sphenostylis stenocarpa]
MLNLSYNPFFPGRIPPELGNLTNLEVLWLTQCNLVGVIPTSLGNLNKLQDLDLALLQRTHIGIKRRPKKERKASRGSQNAKAGQDRLGQPSQTGTAVPNTKSQVRRTYHLWDARPKPQISNGTAVSNPTGRPSLAQ